MAIKVSCLPACFRGDGLAEKYLQVPIRTEALFRGRSWCQRRCGSGSRTESLNTHGEAWEHRTAESSALGWVAGETD